MATEPMPRPDLDAIDSLPNVVTLLGYGCALIWLGGGAWPFAFVSIVADEADGSLARALGASSDYGAQLDRTIDLILTGATAMKLGAPGLAALIPIALAQAATENDRIGFGSWRAFLMSMGMTRQILMR